MRKIIIPCLFAFTFAGVPMLTGCDETIHEEKTVKRDSDGDVTTHEKETTRKPDGSIVTEEHKSVDKN